MAGSYLLIIYHFPSGSDSRESAMQETWVRSLDQEDPLVKGMATHSGILAWRIPWTESLTGYSPLSRSHNTIT